MKTKTYHVVSTGQLLSGALTTGFFAAAAVAFTYMFLTYLDLPEVQVNPDGKCVKVINYKNGDGYQCSDVDVVLRKYHRVIVGGENSK
jgi:hypothetical protein